MWRAKRHGDWVWRLADGGVQEGPYVDGKKQGRWVLRWADGGVEEGPLCGGQAARRLGLALCERGRR